MPDPAPPPDPRIAAVQRYLADEREAGRCVFDLRDLDVARILAAADAALQGSTNSH